MSAVSTRMVDSHGDSRMNGGNRLTSMSRMPPPGYGNNKKGGRPPFSLSEFEFLDEFAVTDNISLHQIVQQSATCANHFQKAATGMVIILVNLQMGSEVVDSFCKQCNLYFR